jgi:hypothetical protein
MGGVIFFLQDDERLVPLKEAGFDSEDLLQRLLAEHSDLLAGEQINRLSPRRWLLVKREAGVPSKLGGSNQWAIDNLFLDQEGVPTIVEVKRSSDTRIRREVVGQMLDYAANAVTYWPAASLRSMFEQYWTKKGDDPAEVLNRFLNPLRPDAAPATEIAGDAAAPMQAEAFWETVDRNLHARRIRMIFVADIVPPELQRIVEFLNEQMSPAEVLAVEIRQYVGQGAKTLVPRVIGQTSQAQATKGPGTPPLPWDRDRFLSVLAERTDVQTAEAASEIMTRLVATGWNLMWGRGAIDGSCQPVFEHKGAGVWPFFLWTSGRVEIQFGHLRSVPPFDVVTSRQALRKRLLAIPGVLLAEEVDKYPAFSMTVLKDKAAAESFLETWQWVGGELRAHLDATA